jgi:hypothetical protein
MGMIDVTDYTVKQIIFCKWVDPAKAPGSPRTGWLSPLRHWIDGIEVQDADLAHRICRLIPSQCPFARQIKLFGRTILTIPPLCELNPIYDELVGLRFRAMCYLADQCGEDVSSYC